MATIGKVSAVFTASTSGLSAGVRTAGSELRKFQGDVSAMRSSLSTLTTLGVANLFGQIASTVSSATRSLISMGQAEADAIDRTSKLAARLGVTYGEMAGLTLAGDLAGVSMDTIGAAATKADVALVRAAQGSAVAQAAFDGIGLSVTDLEAMDPAARFGAITDAIAALPSEAERSVAAVRLFGRSGAELLPLFAGGAGAIREAANQAEAFGLALSTTQGQDVEAMNEAWTKAGAVVRGIVTQVTAYLAPAIQSVADAFTGFVGDVGGATIGQRIGDGILEGARFLAGVGDTLIAGLGDAWGFVSSVADRWSAIFDTVGRVASVFAGVGRGLAAVFQMVVLGFGTAAEMALEAAKGIVDMIPGLKGVADGSLEVVRGFKDGLIDGISANLDAAAANFDAATRPAAEGVAKAAAGPLGTALDAAIERARSSAAAGESPRGGLNVPGAATGAVATQPQQALQAINSRSREGIAEMFRLMRGQTDDVQQKQLTVMERIADNTEDMGFDMVETAIP